MCATVGSMCDDSFIDFIETELLPKQYDTEFSIAKKITMNKFHFLSFTLARTTTRYHSHFFPAISLNPASSLNTPPLFPHPAHRYCFFQSATSGKHGNKHFYPSRFCVQLDIKIWNCLRANEENRVAAENCMMERFSFDVIVSKPIWKMSNRKAIRRGKKIIEAWTLLFFWDKTFR